MLTHDGEGGGSFELANVPKQLTLEDGKTVTVTTYNVLVVVDEKYPYYENENGGFSVTVADAAQMISTLKLKIKAQTLTLAPKVVGDQTKMEFPFQLTFKNADGIQTELTQLTRTVKPSNEQSATLDVPVGLSFRAVQTPVAGYKFKSEYEVTGAENPSIANGAASGTVTADSPVTVTTINYMQNRTYPFTVTWMDKNNPARPTLGAGNFQLQYRTEEGEWTDLTGASLETLGIDALPSFDASNAAQGKYVYRGLPSVDAAGNALEYTVVTKDVPEGYVVTSNDTCDAFTYWQTTTFSATISWLDNHNAETGRPTDPAALSLKLCRRAGDGSYEAVTDAELQVAATGGDTWSISANNLPRLDENGREYDYVVVQESTVGDYVPYYSNSTGNYSNDTLRCHNGGTILERLTGTTHFTATKSWKDEITDPTQRPKTIVTLWRYPLEDSTDPGIDQVYDAGNAAQVVYRKTITGENGAVSYQDILLSYQLRNEDPETISFGTSTIPALPSDDLALPLYDEQGRRYVYFVRETVDSSDYETVYTDFDNGAPNGGTITNIHREKAQINVNKIWRCPSNLANIDGAKIQMTILVPDQNGTLQELTVYSAEEGSYQVLTGKDKEDAQTLSGFSQNIAALDLQFYVNIYDENGLPYDMTKAVVREVKVVNETGTELKVQYGDDGTGAFTLNGDQFIAAGENLGKEDLASGMKQFRFQQTNTISGVRDYTIIKKWGDSILDDEVAQVKSVSFTLQRRSTKNGASYETVKTPEGETTWVVPAEGDRTWQRVISNLPQYDENGYAYLYTASESGVTLKDGATIENNWSVYYYQTEDSVTATNQRGSGGGAAFTISKTWMDNGDTDARQPVTVRAYQKTDLLAALQGMEESRIVPLGELTIGYAQYGLSTDGNWFREVSLAEALGQISKNGRTDITANDVSDLVILEYQVGGQGAIPASYTVSQLRAAAGVESSYLVSGTVSNADRQYQTTAEREAGKQHVILVNTRIGQATVEVTKTWQDEKNAGLYRPSSIQFQIFQDGLAYTLEQDAVIDSSDAPEGLTVTLDQETGILTLSAPDDKCAARTAAEWSFRLKNLPLFSDTGVPHTYNLEEVSGVETSTADPYYRCVKGDATVTPHETIPDRMTYEFSFTNTLTGITSHSLHKSWKDADSGGYERPDLYLTLYRYLKRQALVYPDTPVEQLSSYEQYTDCGDPTLIVDNSFHWRVEVTGLPRYDDLGREYVYRLQEAMNNNGVTVYGKYLQDVVYGVESECATCKDLGIDCSTPYDKVTNTLTAEMTFSGEKVWTGFDGYQIEPEDYPKPTIELYRSLKEYSLLNLTEDGLNVQLAEAAAEGYPIEFVESLELGPDSNGKYTYSFTGLPKFDSEGRKYGLRPTSVTVVLQRSIDGGATWQNIAWNASFWNETTQTGLPSATTGLAMVDGVEQVTDIVSIQLTSDNVIRNTKGNSWHYTFTNLPTQDPAGNKWTYRCVEKKIGNAPMEGEENEQAGAYTLTYPTRNGDKTIIQNKLESTSLYVQKKWQDDSFNLYDSRPDSLTFVLQMRGIQGVTDPTPAENETTPSTEEGGGTGESGSGTGGETGNGTGGETGSGEGDTELTNWTNVKVNGRDYTFTLTPDRWETTLQDLPVAIIGEDGLTYYALYFRAVEVTEEDGKVTGALNYQDVTDYTLESEDHVYNQQLARNESTSIRSPSIRIVPRQEMNWLLVRRSLSSCWIRIRI